MSKLTLTEEPGSILIKDQVQYVEGWEPEGKSSGWVQKPKVTVLREKKNRNEILSSGDALAFLNFMN